MKSRKVLSLKTWKEKDTLWNYENKYREDFWDDKDKLKFLVVRVYGIFIRYCQRSNL